MNSDKELLLRFSEDRTDAAFEGVVKRHLPMVYRAAVRQTRSKALAEDVCQAVFLLLSKNSGKLAQHADLSGWLFVTTRNVARSAMRSERRRERREQQAARPEPVIDRTETSELAEFLDAGISKLRSGDRQAVLMRFLQGKSIAEVAQRIGVSEDAARKRVDRAVGRLRSYFANRGVVMSADLFASALLAESAATYPANLVQAVLHPQRAAKLLASQIARQQITVKIAAAVSTVALAAVGSAIYLQWRPAVRQVSVETPRSLSSKTWTIAKELMPVLKYDWFDGSPIPKGWPVALPGQVIGTPVVADLEGNGKLCIVAPIIARKSDTQLLHPTPTTLGYLYALRLDGSVPPGWPVQITDTPAAETGGNQWAASPTVFREGTRDGILMQTQTPGLFAYLIHGDGESQKVPGGNSTVSPPVIDLDGDGVPDYLTSKNVGNVRGGAVKGWTGKRRLQNGYTACIGDANNDGQLELYHLFYTDRKTGKVLIGGYDHAGNALPGWPREGEDASWFPPAMGDITGDSKKEIVAAYGRRVYAWTWDGKDLPADTSVNGHTGVFATDVSAAQATPTLADLDGDGKAEVIVYDENTGSIRAWHGDGKPVFGSDGVLAEVQGVSGGISVADLGADGVIDLFAGTSWIKFDPKTRTSQITPLFPGEPTTEWTQPTICDVDGDGKADVLFGLSDGRLVIYNTRLSYRADLVQWATVQANFQHTSCWNASGMRAAR